MVLSTVLLLLIHRHEIAKIRRGAVLGSMVIALSLFLGYSFQTTGLKYTEASKSAFLTGLAIILVPVVLKIGWNKHINRWTMLGIVVSLGGLYFLSVPAGSGGTALFTSINVGDWLTLACAVCFALQIVFVGRVTVRHPFGQVALLQIAWTALFMSITAPLLEHVHVVWSATVIWALIITGVFGTAVAFSVQAWAQQFTPPTHTALIFMLEPVFAWVTAFLMGERLGLRSALGAVMILAGVLLSEMLGSAAHPSEELEPKPEEAAG